MNVCCRIAGLAFRLSLFAVVMLISSLAHSQPAPPLPEGPVAYVGHGAMFDRNGNKLEPTPEFIAQAQDFYLRQLLGRADEGQRQRFRDLEARLVRGLAVEGQSRLALNSRIIDWLIRMARPEGPDRLLGINNAMRIQLIQKLPEAGRPREAVPFQMPDELRRRLLEEGLSENATSGRAFARSTTAGGEAYRELCRSNGVPVPPDWGTSAWIFRGALTVDFLASTPVAEVFTFQSASPEGMCIALPRSSGETIQLLGVICLGKASGTACFWDNQSNDGSGTVFTVRRGEVVPFSRFGGGADLVGDGICTDCHAGENPYVIHPGTPLGLPALAGLPLVADRWYQPLVLPDWPQNPGPLNSPGACAACHTAGGPGGRFPQLSTLLRGFCGTVLRQAITRTMPPSAPGSLAGDPHPNSLQAMCAKAPPPATGIAGILNMIQLPLRSGATVIAETLDMIQLPLR